MLGNDQSPSETSNTYLPKSSNHLSNKSKEARRRLRTILDNVCSRFDTTVEASRCPMKNNRKVTYLLNHGNVTHLACFIREKKEEIILIPDDYAVCFEANSHVWIGRISYKEKSGDNFTPAPIVPEVEGSTGSDVEMVAYFEVTPVDESGAELRQLSSGFQENISCAFKMSLSKLREFFNQSETLERASLRPNGRLYIGVYYDTIQKKLREHFQLKMDAGLLNDMLPPVKERLSWWLALREVNQSISAATATATNTPMLPARRTLMSPPSNQRIKRDKMSTTNGRTPALPIPSLETLRADSALNGLQFPFPAPFTTSASFSNPFMDLNLLQELSNMQNNINLQFPTFNNFNQKSSSQLAFDTTPFQSLVKQASMMSQAMAATQNSFQNQMLQNSQPSMVSTESATLETDENLINKFTEQLKPVLSSMLQNNPESGASLLASLGSLREFILDEMGSAEDQANNSSEENMEPDVEQQQIPHVKVEGIDEAEIEEIDLGNFFAQDGYHKWSFGNLGNLLEAKEQQHVVSCNMTPEALYLTLDVQRTKSIGEKEIKKALKCLKIPVNSTIIKKTCEACDKNGDGKISLEEFVQYLKERELELKKQFDRMDLSKDGYVTLDELKAARSAGTFNASDEELKALIEWMDNLDKGRKDGKIEFEEFRTSMILFPPATTIQEIIDLLRNKK